ncbi:MAG: hypothetical protein CMF96_02820 [Candidatus Marinimicrobia bacterium]|nr:hypothetical protein [Candidatus Neomarinimicrobiota bacterium]|tara:strand:- start:1078 stop:1371 length:294 start_codon:yes stop_codon:yes gene_type:complete
MIKLYRLTTGEDIIGVFVEETDLFEFVKKPFVLIPMQGQAGKPMQIGFHPYIPYTKDEVIKFKKANIITEVKPDTNLIEAYEKNTSNIVQLNNKIIT